MIGGNKLEFGKIFQHLYIGNTLSIDISKQSSDLTVINRFYLSDHFPDINAIKTTFTTLP